MRIEIWSDVVCPWCYIGKRRFERALAGFAHHDQVEVVWRSFQLDPDATESDQPPAERLAQKYGVPIAQARAMNERVTVLAAAEGLEFDLERARHGNTFDAHRLLHLAAARGRQGELKERLLAAYFTQGASVADPGSLTALAVAAGLAEPEVREVLAGDRYAAEVRADIAQARAYGITGVPFYVLDAQFGVSGAQPTEVFAEALAQAWSAASPLRVVAGQDDGAACDDGSCAI